MESYNGAFRRQQYTKNFTSVTGRALLLIVIFSEISWKSIGSIPIAPFGNDSSDGRAAQYEKVCLI